MSKLSTARKHNTQSNNAFGWRTSATVGRRSCSSICAAGIGDLASTSISRTPPLFIVVNVDASRLQLVALAIGRGVVASHARLLAGDELVVDFRVRQGARRQRARGLLWR